MESVLHTGTHREPCLHSLPTYSHAGMLVAAIMDGEYASARDVVALTDDAFLRSFEGSE